MSHISGKIIYFIAIILLGNNSFFAQGNSNLQQFYNLIEDNVQPIAEKISTDVKVELTGIKEYSIFKNKLISSLSKNSKFLIDENSENGLVFEFESVWVAYKDVFRDGWFGDFLVQRQVNAKGSYSLIKKGKTVSTDKFRWSEIDSINYSEAKNLEHFSYPFTSAKLPPEPFFSGLLEPIVAIGATIVAVYLFFNVRS